MDVKGFGFELAKKRLIERISVAIFVAGISTVAQATHCVQGTLCYPDPNEMCGLKGVMWCGDGGGDDNNLPVLNHVGVQIPHRADNPYLATCGVSPNEDFLKSASFDLLAYFRERGYNQNEVELPGWGAGPVIIPFDLSEFGVRFSDNSFATLAYGRLAGPGQWDPLLHMSMSPFGLWSIGAYQRAFMSEVNLGPDSSGYMFSGLLVSANGDLEDAISICQKAY